MQSGVKLYALLICEQQQKKSDGVARYCSFSIGAGRESTSKEMDFCSTQVKHVQPLQIGQSAPAYTILCWVESSKLPSLTGLSTTAKRRPAASIKFSTFPNNRLITQTRPILRESCNVCDAYVWCGSELRWRCTFRNGDARAHRSQRHFVGCEVRDRMPGDNRW